MEAANIVDVVSEFVSLRKSGVNYKGLCPFHNDKTPSFYVSPARGICHCFTCGKGGNAVGFIMEHEQMSYPEALRWLAKKYHIEIKERELTDDEKREQDERESMFVVNEWACSYFQNILKTDVDGIAIGMQYFRSRGFRDDIINKFQLGFALNTRDALAKAAISKGYKKEFLVKTGLCIQRDNGELVDRFAGRAMFPWIGISGKVVAFGGRVLDSRTKGVNQKYINSIDSDVYHKDHELFGLYQAKRAITKEDCVYMVEGYTDVISMHQCGIENVVANSGTALSVYQIRLLHRFTSNIVLLYDGDEAGIHAAMRGTDMLLAEGMNIKVLLLPEQDDPDSFARKHTASDFKKYISEHQTDFIEFKTNLLLKGVTDPIKRSEAISSIVKSVSVILDPIIRATYLQECSARLGIQEQTLINSMNKFIRGSKEEKKKEEQRQEAQTERVPEPIRPATPMQQASKVEQMLIKMIIRHGGEIIYQNVETEDGNTINMSVAQYVDYDLSSDNLVFQNDLYNKILAEAVAHSSDDDFDSVQYFTHHPDININKVATDMSIDHFQLSKSLQIKKEKESLRDATIHLILDFRMDYVEAHLKELQKQISLTANDHDKVMVLMAEYQKMQQVRNAIAKKLGSYIVV
jgi:DNA primase